MWRHPQMPKPLSYIDDSRATVPPVGEVRDMLQHLERMVNAVRHPDFAARAAEVRHFLPLDDYLHPVCPAETPHQVRERHPADVYQTFSPVIDLSVEHVLDIDLAIPEAEGMVRDKIIFHTITLPFTRDVENTSSRLSA